MPLVLLIAAIALCALFLWRGAFRTSFGSNSNSETSHTLKNISPQEAYTLIQDQQENPDFVILDVRTPDEFTQAFIEKAVNIDYYSKGFHAEIQGLSPQKTYLVYCRSGNRSANALQLMHTLGFSDVYNMTGGIIGWSRRKLPLVQ